MADHRVSIVSLTPPGPFAVGDQVKVKLKVERPLAITSKIAKVTVTCDAWETPSVRVDARSTASITATFAKVGRSRVAISACVNAQFDPAARPVEVEAEARVAFADPAVAAPVTGVPNGIAIGAASNLRLSVSGGRPGEGAQVRLTSPVFRRPVTASIRPNDPSPLVSVEVLFTDPPRDEEVVLEAVSGCALLGGAAQLKTRVRPVAPTVGLEWRTPGDASKTWLPGAVPGPPIELVLDVAPVIPFELELQGPALLEGKKQTIKVARGQALRRPVEVTLSRRLEEGTHDLTLVRPEGAEVHLDEARRTLRVKATPQLEVAFPPSGWISPDTKEVTAGETARFVARLNRRAPEAKSYAKLTVGRRTPPLELTWQAGTQDSLPLEVTFADEDADPKARVALEAPDESVLLGRGASHTLAIHKANQVTFARGSRLPHRRKKKTTYYPGDVVEVPLKLKYPLVLTRAQEQQGLRQVEVGRITGASIEPADVPVVFDVGAEELLVEVTVKDELVVGTDGAVDGLLRLTPAEGFRSAKSVKSTGTTPPPKGTAKPTEDTFALRLEPSRLLELVGRPWVEAAAPGQLQPQTCEVDFAYPGEPLSIRVSASSALATDTPAGHVVWKLGARRGLTPIVFVAGSSEAVATWDGVFEDSRPPSVPPTPLPAFTGQLSITIEPPGAGGFTTRPPKKKGSPPPPRTLEARPLPTLRFADAPWPTEPGGVAPTQEGTTWVLVRGARRPLRLQLDPEGRPHCQGVTGAVTSPAFAGTKVPLPWLTLATHLRTGVSHQDVTVEVVSPPPPNTPPPPGTTPPPLEASVVDVVNAKAPVAQVVQPGQAPTGPAAKLALRVATTPTIGFAPEGAWLERPTGTAPDAVLRLNDTATVVLECLGSAPTQPTTTGTGTTTTTPQEDWEARLQCAAFSAEVKVGPYRFDGPELADAWRAGRLEVPVTFDKQAATQTTMTLLLGPPPPPPVTNPPPKQPPRAPAPLTTYRGVSRGAFTRTLRFSKELSVQLEPLEKALFTGRTAEDGTTTADAGPFRPGDRVTIKLSLGDLPDDLAANAPTDGLPVARLRSLCFNPPPLAPGAPKPAPGTPPVPGTYEVKLVPVEQEPEDPNQPPPARAWDTEYEATFPVQKAATVDEVEVDLVEHPGSPFVPVTGERSRLRLRVAPLPVLSIAAEQPGFHTAPPPPKPL